MKYKQRSYKRKRSFAKKITGYAKPWAISPASRQIFLPIPAVMKVKLGHEMNMTSTIPIQQYRGFALSTISPRGFDQGGALQPGENWTYPAGMRALHTMYRHSYVESVTFTITSMVQNVSTGGFEMVVTSLSSDDIRQFVGLNGQAVGNQDIGAQYFETLRSRPDTQVRIANRNTGGEAVQTIKVSLQNSKFGNFTTREYSTFSDRTGQMNFPNVFDVNGPTNTPAFAVIFTPTFAEALTIYTRIRCEFNMRFENLHPFQAVNNIDNVY